MKTAVRLHSNYISRECLCEERSDAPLSPVARNLTWLREVAAIPQGLLHPSGEGYAMTDWAVCFRDNDNLDS